MLARSTACRHGDGRTCAKAVSMSSTCPSCTIRLAGLMSRCASPASHSRRTSMSPWSMMSSSTSASPISIAPSKNSVTSRYSRSGVSSTIPDGAAVGMPAVAQEPQGVVLVLHQPADRLERRLVLEPAVEDGAARSCTSGPPGRGSWRRASRTGSVSGSPATRSRSGVEPPEPARPTGFMSTTVTPELVLHGAPDGLASTPADVEVRGLALPVGDREDLVRGEEPEGVDGERHGESAADDDVRRVVDGQVQARQRRKRGSRPRSTTFAIVSGSARDDERVHDRDEEDDQDGDRRAREGVAAPTPDGS